MKHPAISDIPALQSTVLLTANVSFLAIPELGHLSVLSSVLSVSSLICSLLCLYASQFLNNAINTMSGRTGNDMVRIELQSLPKKPSDTVFLEPSPPALPYPDSRGHRGLRIHLRIPILVHALEVALFVSKRPTSADAFYA